MTYPLILATDPETGQVMARFPDIPEAITVGADVTDALRHGLDALLCALAGYIASGRPIPEASTKAAEEPAIDLPAIISAKLALYSAMRRQAVTQTALAEKLGVDPRQMRRLLDLDHRSRMDQLETALAALGMRLVVSAKEAA
ncbi:MAG: type II toxin-antitoxin system HicB family antitoxin [Syntrophobacteraceae bacterium]